MIKKIFKFIGFVLLVFFVASMITQFKSEEQIMEPIAVIKITGPIFSSDDVLKELSEISKNKNVKGLIVRLDSPGGAVAPSQEIYTELKKVSAKIPVLASMGTVAASGAYYIAMGATHIMANEGTITGSIGVIMESVGINRVAEKLLIENRTIKSGKYKDVGNPLRDMNDEERVYLQTFTDDMYDQFTEAVAVGRKLPLEQVRELAQGKIYTGRQALKVGLIDEIGNLNDALMKIKQLAKLPDDAKVHWPKEESPFDKFMNGDVDSLLSEIMSHSLFFMQGLVPQWRVR